LFQQFERSARFGSIVSTSLALSDELALAFDPAPSFLNVACCGLKTIVVRAHGHDCLYRPCFAAIDLEWL
jgi:hypothetical protein